MIDKKIHQIWLGDKRIPSHIKDYMDDIKNNHPNFEYTFWNDSNIPVLPSNLKKVFDSLEHPAMKSDLMRVYILKLHGGVYIDVDYKLVTNIDNLDCFSSDKDAFVIYPKIEKIEDINNSILISCKEGNLINHMISNITYEKQWLGPHWYADCLYSFFSLEKFKSYEDILIACDNNNIGYMDEHKLNKEIITHKFLASWYPGSKWKEKFDSGNYE